METHLLSDFSRLCAERILTVHPEWDEFARVVDAEHPDGGIVEFEVPSPSVVHTHTLFISTDEDELTVGLDKYHTHFEPYAPTDEEVVDEALDFIQGILDERYLIAVLMKEQDWSGSRVVEHSGLFVIPDAQQGYVVSWRDSYTEFALSPGIVVVGSGQIPLSALSLDQINANADQLLAPVKWDQGSDRGSEWVYFADASAEHRRRFDLWLDSKGIASDTPVLVLGEQGVGRDWSDIKRDWQSILVDRSVRVVSRSLDWILEVSDIGIARFGRKIRAPGNSGAPS